MYMRGIRVDNLISKINQVITSDHYSTLITLVIIYLFIEIIYGLGRLVCSIMGIYCLICLFSVSSIL
jgi:hypothetical protein